MSSWQTSRGYTLLHGGFTSGTANSTLEVQGLDETIARFEQMKADNPQMEKIIRGIIKTVIKEARNRLSDAARRAIDNDPRGAYRAVRSSVYRRIFGANLNILTGRHAARKGSVPNQTFSTVTDKNGQHRGGNRRTRSSRTTDIMSYVGADRGFILRWLNDGTKQRHISTMNNTKVNKTVGRGHTSASLNSKRNGNRGSIAGHHWFKGASMTAMEDASQRFAELLSETLSKMWEGGIVGTVANDD